MTKTPTRRQLVAIPPDDLVAIEAARKEEAARTREPVSRAAMIRILLRRGLNTPLSTFCKGTSLNDLAD